MDFVTSHFRKMKLWPVEHRLNTFSTYLSSKLDSPLIKTLERENLILMINMLKKCSTCVQLVRVSSFRNDLLQNPYFNRVLCIICTYLEKQFNTVMNQIDIRNPREEQILRLRLMLFLLCKYVFKYVLT